ncbi:MAG: undecaprenyl/decaprenyl-phosphate alpha-N-acetylglucosaminyl 1-phosphate transferase, partial [Oscillospiraceae bacterium]
MPISSELAVHLLLTIAVAFIISFSATPIVKSFAQKVGAMDVPGEARRVHDHPIPRMGGLAIFLGFLLSVLLFVDIDRQLQGVLLGCVIIVA